MRVLLVAGVVSAPSLSWAETPADCVTLLNEVSSAVSQIRGWQGTDGVTVVPIGDNGPAIERVTKDLTRAREGYDKALACANAEEVRRHPGYAQARERFARDFPKYQQEIQEGGATYKVFGQAIETDNHMKDLVRRLMAADPAAYDAEAQHAAEGVAEARQAATDNPFLDEAWFKGIDGAVHGHLVALQAKKGKLDRQAARDALVAHSVVKKLPAFSAEDAASPKKVAEAFAQMPAEALVALPLGESLVHHRYVPVAKPHPPESNLEMRYPDDKEPPAPAFVFYNQRTVFVRYKKDELPRLTAPVPGFVWDVADDGQVVFVSASGGRYLTHIDHVVPAAEAGAPLARGVVNGVLIHDDVVALSERGVLDARYGRDMAAAKAAYGDCAEKVWKAHEAAFHKIDQADILPETRRNRRMDLDGKVRKSIDGKCKAHQVKYAKAWDKAMSDYSGLRALVVAASAPLLPAEAK
ncbi:MAG: hypothetical protein EP329_02770 [Deltaproteobacteria bacterium]|nr:MAG: hypothetical protein EP329_02770 [Deltaproteobacteria bacterium]